MGRRRKNGDGTIRFRESDGRWEGRLIVGYDENGKAIRKTVTAKTKTECENKLSKIKKTTVLSLRKRTNQKCLSENGWISGIRTIVNLLCDHTLR